MLSFSSRHGYVNRRENPPLLIQMNLPKSSHHTDGNLDRGRWCVTYCVTAVVEKIFLIAIFQTDVGVRASGRLFISCLDMAAEVERRCQSTRPRDMMSNGVSQGSFWNHFVGSACR